MVMTQVSEVAHMLPAPGDGHSPRAAGPMDAGRCAGTGQRHPAINAATVIATCHPNRDLGEFDLTGGAEDRTFPVPPRDMGRQRTEIDHLILAAGSYHQETRVDEAPGRRRNTAVAGVRGHDHPLTHNKYSPADRPVVEDIQPDSWPQLRVYVTVDGWHLTIAPRRGQPLGRMTGAVVDQLLGIPSQTEPMSGRS